MIKQTISKTIVSLIMSVILIAGFIACADNNDITGSVENSLTQVVDSGGNAGENSGDIEEDNSGNNTKPSGNLPTWGTDYVYVHPRDRFPKDTYMEIMVPFSKNVRVSYQDTETLDQLWKDVVDRTDKFPRDGNRRLYIKTANTWDGEKGGNFYFDNDYNIRWDKKPEWIMKIFRGGAIIEYLPGLTGNDTPDGHNPKGGGDYNGRWALGGIYSYGVGWHSHIKTIPMSDEIRNYPKIFFGMGSPNDTKYASMTEYREVGKTEVLVLHLGMAVDLGTGRWEVDGKKAWNLTDNHWTGVAYAAQIYMDFEHDRGSGFWKEIRGQNPLEYMGRFKEKGPHQIYKWGFRFASDRTYNIGIGYSGSGTKW